LKEKYMPLRALVVEDDEDIASTVLETLISMGHDHEWVKSQEEARGKIQSGGYHYVLLDLQIPIRFGQGLPCIEFGAHLARDMHLAPAMQGVPIIVMTAYGKEGLEIAADLCGHGVVDFINKPFPKTGRTLASVIQAVLERTRRKRETLEALSRDQLPTQTFRGGELVFFENRVELCGVKVVCGATSTQIYGVLSCLRAQLPNGRYKAFDGNTLAEEVDADGGQGSIAGSVRDFRLHVAEVLGRELGFKVGLQDVIESSSGGYRFKPWIRVRQVTGLPPAQFDPDNAPLPVRRKTHILQTIREGKSMRIPDLASTLKCSRSTIKRLVEQLKADGQLVFEGPARSGSFRCIDTQTKTKTS
jgi:DNA-binding response OmpR family regulator